MKAMVIPEPGRAVIREVPEPEPGPGEVVVSVKAAGICGTDFHIFEGDSLGSYPIIPGHEFAGVVAKVGPAVTSLAVGDRVAVDPSLFCGRCRYCLTNRGNHCENWGGIGTTVPGGFAEQVAVPESSAFRLPDALSFQEGAFVEPVACVVHGINRLNLRPGERVLLFGAGAMGQQLVQALVHAGAAELTAVDVDPGKLALARRFGATRTVLAAALEKELGGELESFDAVVDATGAPAVIETALRFLGPAGKFLQFGVAPKRAKISLSPFDLYRRDWTLIGSMAINHTFLPALEWVAAGRIQVKPLLSKTIPLEELPEFLGRPKAPELLKVQVVF
ncbi:zinc-dependent alcohol dehydrogenase family protein [Kyrpidia tusciae]|uniref:Alcohol dehydrogenase GroES domain protein n=1 Tax=Kyrpidia tusciae (strain DSM 2912 / NBRC 15312 / T2) TaxID=562970 RepID=D5WT05_KYRT2|nr:zinc-dependent alcohol dehydrogenase family protein [Kyrpidia tusciae]ADG05109.1 Alcohol dehydrogenase GroES domain protein [Kyrpidia tusciae DSM 2912]